MSRNQKMEVIRSVESSGLLNRQKVSRTFSLLRFVAELG